MKNIPVLAASFVALVALAQQGQPHDRKPIDVQVINGEIVVGEREAHTTQDEGALVWKMSTDGYQFPESGIVVASDGKHDCHLGNDPRIFRCEKKGHIQGERYKYVVKVVPSGSQQPVKPLDPWIVND
jgi:hypothetical protein